VICTVKLDEEKSKYAGLGQENGFGSAYVHSLWWLVKGPEILHTCRKEYNKYDLTVLSVSDWLIIMIGPGGLLL
jgi:hypothetical protein